MKFLGYCRKDGRVGTRNLVGIISTVVCANEVTEAIARNVQGTSFFIHQQGCCQTPIDLKRVLKTLIGLGKNPNLASVLLISLGCESVELEKIKCGIEASYKRVESLKIQEVGGAAKAIALGTLLAQDMVHEASSIRLTSCPVSELVLGLKCGSSDTTSGLFSNPALGIASDRLVEMGATSILGEVTEFIGAEHILAKHALTPEIGQKISNLTKNMENRAKSTGCDIRGGQPTGGNIKGGLTTIEEKSLGAIAKAGNSPINGVYEYGEQPDKKGLVVMDSPGREPEILTGLAAAGCNIIAFTTGKGAPQGFPFIPVLKITANENTWKSLRDHMDLWLNAFQDKDTTLGDLGKQILDELLITASGRLTKAEISGYTRSMDIYTIGPVI
ncbi:UxaA family hydrolase [bacterium]|nr:UxaA family hydrolase [bacterium]